MSTRGVPSLGLCACLTLALLAGCAEGEQPDQGSGRSTVVVERVIDGDTVELTRFGKTRLIGVDAPEEGGCGANAATRFTRQRLEGKPVEYEPGKEPKDRYGRTLAYLTRGDTMHNLALVQKGYAKVLTIPPNDKYAGRFEAAGNEAKQQEAGPQGTCVRRARVLAAKRARARQRAEARAAETQARAVARRAEQQARAAATRVKRRIEGSRSRQSRGNIPKSCKGVKEPITTPPGDPTNIDRDDDGQACE